MRSLMPWGRHRRSTIPGSQIRLPKLRHTIAACCQQAAIAAAFAYCGWFALGEGGALILAAMALLALAWRPADPNASHTTRIQLGRDGIDERK